MVLKMLKHIYFPAATVKVQIVISRADEQATDIGAYFITSDDLQRRSQTLKKRPGRKGISH